MTMPLLYNDLAHLWPLLSPPEDYAADAELVRDLLEAHLPEAAQHGERRLSLLELGAGGGHTLFHLCDEYDCTAVDLSEPMLANCRRLNPSVHTQVGDMRRVRLDRTFDAVLIHDAIDYMTSADDVLATLSTAAAHLEPGGVALIAPTYIRETFHEHETEADHNADESLALTYFSYVHHLAGSPTQFEMILLYLLKQPPEGGKVTVYEDRHLCGLFSEAQWLEWMQQAGFSQAVQRSAAVREPEEQPWTMFVGVRA